MTSSTSDDGRLHIGAAVVVLHLPGVDSLKAKRTLVKRAQAVLTGELGASVAEVGHQDSHRRSTLGVTVAASTSTGADRALDRVRPLIERDPRVEVTSIDVDAWTMDVGDGDPDRDMLGGLLGELRDEHRGWDG